MTGYKIRWARPNAMRHIATHGFDDASTFEEACEIAKARLSEGGLNSRANIYRADDDNTPVRYYGIDFDARLYHVEVKP